MFYCNRKIYFSLFILISSQLLLKTNVMSDSQHLFNMLKFLYKECELANKCEIYWNGYFCCWQKRLFHVGHRNDKVEKRQNVLRCVSTRQTGRVASFPEQSSVGSGLEVGRLYILSCTKGKHLSSMITCEDDVNNKISKLSFV